MARRFGPLSALLALTGMLAGAAPAICDEVNVQDLQSGYGQPHYNYETLKDINEEINDTPTAQKFKLRAMKLRKLGLHKDAVDDLNKALEMAPGDSASFVLRGENYLDEGMYPEAVSDLNNAIKADPNLLEAYAARGSAHNKMKEFGKAVEDANRVLQIEKNNPLGLLIRGAAYDGLKNYDKAIEDCSAAINQDSDLAKAYNYRAFAYQSKGQYQKAVDDYSKAIELRPDYRAALLGRAWSLYNLGKVDDAVSDSSKAIRFDSQTLYDMNKYAGEKRYQDSPVPDSEYLVGMQIDEDLKNAVKLYDDVLKSKPDRRTYRERGIAYMHLGKYEEALKDFELANKGVDFNGDDFPGIGSKADYEAARASYEKGNKLLNSGDYQNSAVEYQKALKLYPQYAKCWHNLAIAQGYLNQFFNAELCCIRALSYRPDDWKLWNTLGFELFNEYQHDKGDPIKLDLAKTALKRSLALRPPGGEDKQDVRKLLARVESYERSLCPSNYVIFTTMPIN